MENRLNKISADYVAQFKNNVKKKSIDLGLEHDAAELVQYVANYGVLKFEKEDLLKRKRKPNQVPPSDRCCAKRASGAQCTRRKKENMTDANTFCGTHLKGVPHGVVSALNELKPTTQTVEVWAQDIQGIIYYIDKLNNVYQAEDIVRNKVNPKVIAKYVKQGEEFHIPDFNI